MKPKRLSSSKRPESSVVSGILEASMLKISLESAQTRAKVSSDKNRALIKEIQELKNILVQQENDAVSKMLFNKA